MGDSWESIDLETPSSSFQTDNKKPDELVGFKPKWEENDKRLKSVTKSQVSKKERRHRGPQKQKSCDKCEDELCCKFCKIHRGSCGFCARSDLLI